jgi:hypothetical protein
MVAASSSAVEAVAAAFDKEEEVAAGRELRLEEGLFVAAAAAAAVAAFGLVLTEEVLTDVVRALAVVVAVVLGALDFPPADLAASITASSIILVRESSNLPRKDCIALYEPNFSAYATKSA